MPSLAAAFKRVDSFQFHCPRTGHEYVRKGILLDRTCDQALRQMCHMSKVHVQRTESTSQQPAPSHQSPRGSSWCLATSQPPSGWAYVRVQQRNLSQNTDHEMINGTVCSAELWSGLSTTQQKMIDRLVWSHPAASADGRLPQLTGS